MFFSVFFDHGNEVSAIYDNNELIKNTKFGGTCSHIKNQ